MDFCLLLTLEASEPRIARSFCIRVTDFGGDGWSVARRTRGCGRKLVELGAEAGILNLTGKRAREQLKAEHSTLEGAKFGPEGSSIIGSPSGSLE